MELYLFNKILYLKVDLVKIVKNIYEKKIRNKNVDYKKINKDIMLEKILFKNLKNKIDYKKIVEVKKLKVNLLIDTEDYILTSIVNFFITIILTYIYSKIIINNEINNDLKQYDFSVNSKFLPKNAISINIAGIINIKIVNAINIIIKLIILKRKECKKQDERTSNRKFNDYSYE